MRKIFALLCVSLCSAALYAGPVSPEKALQVAARVFESAPATKGSVGGGLQIVWDGSFVQTKGLEEPDFYVITRQEGGYVMVAGHDNVRPVLGFSFENDFRTDNMPANVRWWMERLKHYCAKQTTPSAQVREAWNTLLTPTKGSSIAENYLSGEYLGSRTVQWDQTNPANYYCPKVTGESKRAVCGCVPLAISEVMVWFGEQNWDAGVGTVPSYTYETDLGYDYTVPSHNLGTVYRWAELQELDTPDEFYAQANYDYYGNATQITSLGKNLGQLVYDVGTLLQAYYNYESGTGATLELINSAVGVAMGYNQNAKELYIEDYPAGRWGAMVRDEVAKHPIYYSGFSSKDGSGHAYVADGYADYMGDLAIHINFGWGGEDNGYYFADVQDEFDEWISALFDFYPNPNSTPDPTFLSFIWYDNEGGLTLASSGGSTVTLNYADLFAQGSEAFNGKIAVFVVDKDNQRGSSALFTDDATIELGYIYFNSVSFSKPGNLQLGDRYKFYYKHTGGNEWLPVQVEDNGLIIGEIPCYDVPFIKTKAQYSTGDFFVFQLMNHTCRYNESTWTVTFPDGSESEYTFDDYRIQLSQPGEYRIRVEIPDAETIEAYINVE